jgi:hypothetical protein
MSFLVSLPTELLIRIFEHVYDDYSDPAEVEEAQAMDGFILDSSSSRK